MANIKITELTGLTTPQDTDVVPIVDNSGTPTTKKTLWSSIKATLKTYFDTLYESLSNKKTTLADDSDTYYPSQKAVKTAVDAKEDAANKETSALDTSTTKYPCNNVVKTAVDGKAPKDITINTQETDAYTLVLADDGKLVDIDYATAATLTVPKNSVVAFPVGSMVAIRQKGAGQVTIAPVDGDVTINNADGLKITDQYIVVALIKVATDTWNAVGSLEA